MPITLPANAPLLSPPVATPETPPTSSTNAAGTTAATPSSTTVDPAATFTSTPGTASPLPPSLPGGIAGTLAKNPQLAALAAKADPVLLAKLATPQGQQQVLAQLQELLVKGELTKKQEAQLFGVLGALSASGQLVPALQALAAEAEKKGALPASLSPEKKQALVLQLAAMIDAGVAARGLGRNGAADAFVPWDQLAKEHLRAVRATAVPPRGPGNASAFLDARFLDELQHLAGAKLVDGTDVKPLIDGPASFAERSRMIKDATSSIHILSWAFYDDDTGWATAKELIAKKQKDPAIDIKILVDGQVAAQPGHGAVLAELEKAGIPVVRWRDPARPHDGNHRKCMIVDGKEAVCGGTNFGNNYSHMGPASAPKWRDTDVLVRGRGVDQASALFRDLWNTQVDTHNLPHAKQNAAPANAPVGNARAMVVDDTPGPKGSASILLTTLKAIEGATTSVDIENAYFIETPALKAALMDALARGVKVRVLTNSPESVDEPIVSAPIQQSLPDLVAAGAEVYLKQGDTLHSKFMVVDGLFTEVGSYNLHPRSERYEGEMVYAIVDDATAKAMGSAFDDDVKKAKRIMTADEVKVPVTAFSEIARRFFFDQL
jgi:cardiolipin synthase